MCSSNQEFKMKLDPRTMTTQAKFETFFNQPIRCRVGNNQIGTNFTWLSMSSLNVLFFLFIKAENLDLPSLKSNVFKKSDKTWLWQ